MNDHSDHSSWMPHGFCFNWDPIVTIMWLIGNIGTWVCYMIIPIVLFRIALVTYVNYPQTRRLHFWFASFIFSCGCNHFLHAYTLWYPEYYVESLFQLVTFIVSLSAIINLIRSLPIILQQITHVVDKDTLSDDRPQGT